MRGPNDVRGSCPKCNEDYINSRKDRVKTACAYCGKELSQDEIKDYFENNPEYQNMAYQGLISEEEQCPYCGYHNDFIEEVSSDLHYSIIT